MSKTHRGTVYGILWILRFIMYAYVVLCLGVNYEALSTFLNK